MEENTVCTHGFSVTVKTTFIPERSNPSIPVFFFAYYIHIKNDSDEPAKLLRRRWEITNAFGETEIVEGDGVLGKQPKLEPGNDHNYTSFCTLPTEFGFMEGNYEMAAENGNIFKISIPLFKLVLPAAVN